MSDSPHVVAVCGSLREPSYTRISLRHALEAAEEAGGTGALVDLREYDLGMFDAGADDPADAETVKRRVREADAVLLGTPMYHGSYSSPLKTALDYCGFDELEGKTVGLLAVSGGAFPVTALEHLRSVCRALDAWVLPHQAAVPRASNQFEDGEFADESLENRVETLGERIVAFAHIQRDPRTFESAENVGATD